MAKVIRRCSPFSEEESSILFDILRKHLNLVEPENFDILSIAIRSNTWQSVCEEFNSHSAVKQRSQIQLKRFWENRKAKIKRSLQKLLTANNELGKSESPHIDNQLFEYSTSSLRSTATPVGASLFSYPAIKSNLTFPNPEVTPHFIESASYTVYQGEGRSITDSPGTGDPYKNSVVHPSENLSGSHLLKFERPPTYAEVNDRGGRNSMLEPESADSDGDMDNGDTEGARSKAETAARLARLRRRERQEEELHAYRLREAAARAAAAEAERRAAEDAETWAAEERARAAQRDAELHRLNVERLQLELDLLRAEHRARH
ncbi:afadin-like isoform X1 [Schistocerca nitens]|uniref:afadin-like isoform X1 n=1 Tax=Schistocerca nitens TaxID=7011 RepID=UPI00211830F2|nr:afadin-like isoform X1 [Schistocerca nitens]